MREIELKPSRRLGLLLLGMAALALAAIWLAALPEGVRLALAAAVIGLTAWGGRQARFTASLRIHVDGSLQFLEQGEWRSVEVLGDSLVSPALVVLRHRTPTKRVRSLVLLADSAQAEDLRRLRVALRWAGRTRSDTASPDAG